MSKLLVILMILASTSVVTYTADQYEGQYVNNCQEYTLKSCFPLDCTDVHDSEFTSDGVYLIFPNGPYSAPVQVYCDMTTPNGPWTVFQKRFNGSENFYRSWEDYKSGFGQADSEYWLGLENIYQLTLQRSYRLRIDLTDFDDDSRFVIYNTFSLSSLPISSVADSYKLYINGFQEGNPSRPAGDSLGFHHNMAFSTYDRDRDLWPSNCATSFKGGFWYNACHHVNLNGLYLGGPTSQYGTGMSWTTWRGLYYSLKTTQMKIAMKK